jgi:hypothetical protein
MSSYKHLGNTDRFVQGDRCFRPERGLCLTDTPLNYGVNEGKAITQQGSNVVALRGVVAGIAGDTLEMLIFTLYNNDCIASDVFFTTGFNTSETTL